MSGNIRSIADLEQFLRTENIFSKYAIDKIGIFGSLARGEKFNDIDLLIEAPITLQHAYDLKKELEEKLHIKVDIVLTKYAEPIILYRALKDVKYAATA